MAKAKRERRNSFRTMADQALEALDRIEQMAARQEPAPPHAERSRRPRPRPCSSCVAAAMRAGPLRAGDRCALERFAGHDEVDVATELAAIVGDPLKVTPDQTAEAFQVRLVVSARPRPRRRSAHRASARTDGLRRCALAERDVAAGDRLNGEGERVHRLRAHAREERLDFRVGVTGAHRPGQLGDCDGEITHAFPGRLRRSGRRATGASHRRPGPAAAAAGRWCGRARRMPRRCAHRRR